MAKYVYTIKIPFEALDDIDARKMIIHTLALSNLSISNLINSEEKLQEIYPDKSPRKVEL